MSADLLFPSRLMQLAAIPCSLLYGAAIALRRHAEPVRVKARVISIGNLHVGGTGKTPHVLAVASHLAARGKKVAVVSRGYGGQLSREGARVTPEHRALDVGDEPREIASRLAEVPVFIGADRVRAAEQASWNADTLVLDDGFQHRRLARNLDIVVVPAAADPGRQHLLPWGRLREPLNALARADALVVLKEPGDEDHTDAWRARFDGPVHVSERVVAAIRPYPGTVEPVALLGRSVVALSGIGRPERFHAALKAAGALVVEELAFRDHHRFTEAELALAGKLARSCDGLVVMTAKDEARIDGRRLPFAAAVLVTDVQCDDLLRFIDERLP